MKPESIETIVYVEKYSDSGTETQAIVANDYVIDAPFNWLHVIKSGQKVASYRLSSIKSVWIDTTSELYWKDYFSSGVIK